MENEPQQASEHVLHLNKEYYDIWETTVKMRNDYQKRSYEQLLGLVFNNFDLIEKVNHAYSRTFQLRSGGDLVGYDIQPLQVGYNNLMTIQVPMKNEYCETYLKCVMRMIENMLKMIAELTDSIQD